MPGSHPLRLWSPKPTAALCTLINATIKYAPPTRGQCRPMAAHLARTINVTDTHGNFASAALSYLIYSCNLHTCEATLNHRTPDAGGRRPEAVVHVTSAASVCLMLLIDFQSQLAGPANVPRAPHTHTHHHAHSPGSGARVWFRFYFALAQRIAQRLAGQ